jgi:hypothetical protein
VIHITPHFVEVGLGHPAGWVLVSVLLVSEPRTARPGALTRATFPSCGPRPFLGAGPYGAKHVARRADHGRAIE